MWRAIVSFTFGFVVAYWLKEQTEQRSPTHDELPLDHVDRTDESTAVAEPESRPNPIVLTPEPATAVVPDDLTKIKGIGKVFAQRLQDGGIATYAQLSMATAEKIHELLEVKEWQKVDIVSWQTEAAELASD